MQTAVIKESESQGINGNRSVRVWFMCECLHVVVGAGGDAMGSSHLYSSQLHADVVTYFTRSSPVPALLLFPSPFPLSIVILYSSKTSLEVGQYICYFSVLNRFHYLNIDFELTIEK